MEDYGMVGAWLQKAWKHECRHTMVPHSRGPGNNINIQMTSPAVEGGDSIGKEETQACQSYLCLRPPKIRGQVCLDCWVVHRDTD